MNDYKSKSDEELIRMLRSGRPEVTDYLMEKYKNLVRGKANTLFLIGGDTDDLIQEGMIGLFKAIRDYDETREASFRHFAELCVTRQLYTVIEASNRKKNTPLNSYVPLDTGASDTEPPEELLLAFQEASPEELVIRAEDLRDLKRAVTERLSSMEKKVLSLYLSGMSYLQIAEALNKPPKSIDNALQRIKRKVTDGIEL